VSENKIPKRKYLSEHAVNLYSGRFIVVTPGELMSGGVMDPQAEEVASQCHIYLICKRPSTYFIKESFNFDGEKVSGDIAFKINGKEQKLPFELPFSLCDGAVRVEVSPYPHRKLVTIDEEGGEIRYVPAYSLSLTGIVDEPTLRNLEVLYVGQAYGGGKRSAFDRLKNHSTLQKILANMQQDLPDEEPLILSFEYIPYRTISSIDGTTKDAIGGDEDSRRFVSILDNPLTDHQQICLIEASLIRYFQPRYNEIYKESFPANNQKILDSCFELDFSALIVEINTEPVLYLYSDKVAPAIHHIATFDLIDSTKRRSFFTFKDHQGKAIDISRVNNPKKT